VIAIDASLGIWVEFLKAAGTLKVSPVLEIHVLGNLVPPGFGADPYLAGEAAFETIVGIQNAGVQAWYTVFLQVDHHIDSYPQCKALYQQVRLSPFFRAGPAKA
jgi:hypothetical protein